MEDIRLQIGCLAIIIYIVIMYVKETLKKDIACNKYFDAILYVAPWAVVFDAVTVITVNRLGTVPNIVNVCLHLIYLIFMVTTLALSAIYIYDKLVIIDEHNGVKRLLIMLWLITIVLILVGSRNLHFVEGVKTNYSIGFSVYLCFAAVAVFYGFIFTIVFALRHNIPIEKQVGAASFVVIIGILLAMQLIFPEFLVASICPTIMVLGMYIVFEDPALRRVELQNEKMIDSFATLVENRDDNTGGHIKRTKEYVSLLLKMMQHDKHYTRIMTKDYITYVTEAAPLHDIGKIATPDEILLKPGKLTDEEYEIMKQHAEIGGDIILNTFKDMYAAEPKRIVCEVARYHHEKYNGKGYPEGLVGEEIPLHARIMAIADVFDAISQKRCYRDAMPLDRCFSIIENGAGTDFDPYLVKLFLDARDEVTVLCENNRNA